MEELGAIASAVFRYLRQHPDELLRALKNAALLRVGVPVAALNWLGERPRRMGKGIGFEAVPPGVRVTSSFELMATPVRASGIIYVESLNVSSTAVRCELRLAELSLKVLDERAETPIAALLRSGALDLSKPGNLMAYMPRRPPIVVEARDDRVVLDLLKHPKLAADTPVRKALEILTPILTLSEVQTDAAHLDIGFGLFPKGVSQAIPPLRDAVRDALALARRKLVTPNLK